MTHLLPMVEAIEIVEDAFREKGLGKVQMPSKPYLYFPRYGGDLRVMPAYIESLDFAGVKIVNSHPENPERHGLPSVIGTLILIDPRTGEPKAIMGANGLTAMRTGAAGAVAARHLARQDSGIVGLVGSGVQARTQLLGLGEVLKDIVQVRVHDLRRERADVFCKDEMWPDAWSMEAVDTPRAAVKGSDVVVTTTPSRSPIIRRSWIAPGTHINAIGADAPGKQELELQILLDSRIVVDDWEQACHGGEISRAVSKGIVTKETVYGELGEVVCGKVSGRVCREDITVFDSTGLGIQDIGVAAYVYKRAVQEDRGQQIDIW